MATLGSRISNRRRSRVSFGRDLQLERENRGVSLEQLAEGTKVPSRFLYALEADDFGCLPGGVFNKGIVSSYCRHLGIAEESWLARFAASAQTTSDEHDWAVFAENVKRNRVQMGTGMRRRWWGVLLLLVMLGALAWVAWRYVIQPGVRPSGVLPVGAFRLQKNAGQAAV